MSILFASIGTILGSLIFVLADFRALVPAFLCLIVSTLAFTTLAKYRVQILTCLTFLLLVFFNYNLRSEYLEYYDMSAHLHHHGDYYLEIVKPVKENRYFQSELVVEIKDNNPSLITRLREFFLPHRFLVTEDSSKAFSKGDVIEFARDITAKEHVDDRLFADHELEPLLEKLSEHRAHKYKKDKVFNTLDHTWLSEKIEMHFVRHKSNLFDDLREQIKRFYFKHLQKDDAKITTSLLFGSRIIDLPELFLASIRKLGLGHFFAASGFHLLILTLFLQFVFGLFKFNKAISNLLSVVITFVYAGLAGFSPSIVRAFVVLVAYLLVDSLGRKFHSLRFLLILAGIVLLVDPYTMFDLGFQFSYLATIGILVWATAISKKLEPLSHWLGERFQPVLKYFLEIIAVSLSVQVFLVPVIIYYFKSFPVWSIIANLILTPLLSLMIVLSFLGLSFIISPLLFVSKAVIAFFASLPYNDMALIINLPSLVLLAIVFVLLALFLLWDDLGIQIDNSQKESEKDHLSYLKEIVCRFFNDRLLRFAAFVAVLFLFVAKTLPLVNLKTFEVHNSEFNPRIKKVLAHNKESFEYFEDGPIKGLVIRNASSMKVLHTLLDELEEVHLLVWPRMKASDIYVESFLKYLKPDVVIASTKSHSSKVTANLEALAANSNLLLNSARYQVYAGKYWSINPID